MQAEPAPTIYDAQTSAELYSRRNVISEFHCRRGIRRVRWRTQTTFIACATNVLWPAYPSCSGIYTMASGSVQGMALVGHAYDLGSTGASERSLGLADARSNR